VRSTRLRLIARNLNKNARIEMRPNDGSLKVSVLYVVLQQIRAKRSVQGHARFMAGLKRNGPKRNGLKRNGPKMISMNGPSVNLSHLQTLLHIVLSVLALVHLI